MTWRVGWRRRTRREIAASLILLSGLTAFVVLVYVVVVLGFGGTSSPSLLLSVIATAVVAVAFDPVQRMLERLAGRLVHGGTPPAYDVWERFSATVTGSYPAQELPTRMARALAEGTGAEWAQVWLMVQDRPSLAATWPPSATLEETVEQGPGRRSLPVRHGGEVLGFLVLREHAPLTSVEERLFAGPADQAGLVPRSARLRAELSNRAGELSRRADELRASRQRLVDVQDERRRTLERDIHDGAQQHLVALAVNLRLAQTVAERSPERAHDLLAAQREATAQAIDTLVQLSRGIYPTLLAGEGLVAALQAAAATSPVPVVLHADGVGRYDASIEAAAYFSCLEALQNAAKHSGATSVAVYLRGEPHGLEVTVDDDGSGFDPTSAVSGTGLASLRDRVETLGGTVLTDSAPGRGTKVSVLLPLQPVGV